LLPIDTEVQTDPNTLEAIRTFSITVYCRHCKAMHDLPMNKAIFAGEAPKPYRAPQSN
jgi:hypothetical protein